MMIEGLLQPTHLLLILLIAILVFGPKKLPEIGKSLGQAIRGFKDSMDHAQEDTKAVEAGSPASAPTLPENEKKADSSGTLAG